jgi:hypothetical protein
MKKPLKYKKFIIIFAAILVLLPIIYFSVGAIFPLPPQRPLTITEKKTLLASFPGKGNLADRTEFSVYDENSFLITARFHGINEEENTYDDEKDRYIIYIVTKDGAVLRSFEPPFVVKDSVAFEDGNIALFYGDENTLYMTEYTADFEVLSERTVPLPAEHRDWYTDYKNGLFCYVNEEKVMTFDRNFENLITYSDEKVYDRYLFFASDGTPYYDEWRDEDPSDGVSAYKRSVKTVDGKETDFVRRGNNFIVSGVFSGDSEYPLYGVYSEDSIFDELFNYSISGIYLCGLTADGKVQTILEHTGADTIYFYLGIPFNGKRYNAYGEYDENIGGSALYLYEYTTSYED